MEFHGFTDGIFELAELTVVELVDSLLSGVTGREMDFVSTSKKAETIYEQQYPILGKVLLTVR